MEKWIQELGCKKQRKTSLDKYYSNPSICKYCDNVIEVKDYEKACDVKKRIFCNQSCSASYNNKFTKIKYDIKYCLNCKKQLNRDKNYKVAKYCNGKCQQDHLYKQYIQRWKDGLESGTTGKCHISNHIRRYMFEKNNSKCCKCGWSKVNPVTGNIPLQIHHIDGNWRNNEESNLELICPNCHTLTDTYGSLNKNGRPDKY